MKKTMGWWNFKFSCWYSKDLLINNVDNTSDANKPVSTAQAAADTTLNSAKTYADGLVVGLWDDRGNYSAATNVFPSAGGSGAGGAILKGDIWTISAVGTLGGVAVSLGDTVRALSDAPVQVVGSWSIAVIWVIHHITHLTLRDILQI
jgi:hypothetical protein